LKFAPRPVPVLAVLVAVACLALGGCSTLGKLAFWRKPAVAPEIAQELVAEAPAGGDPPALPQTWQRNAVRVDLTAVAGEGSMKIRPIAGHAWPVRIEFLVRPGSFAQLEVRADQRVILNVPAGAEAVVLRLPAGVYSATTRVMEIGWGGTLTDPATAPPAPPPDN